jgi:hypothetical protein
MYKDMVYYALSNSSYESRYNMPSNQIIIARNGNFSLVAGNI